MDGGGRTASGTAVESNAWSSYRGSQSRAIAVTEPLSRNIGFSKK
jgi:hypothetical protein